MDGQTIDQTRSGERDPTDELLTARQAAARLGLAERTVRRAIARGDLPAAKHGGTFQIAPSDLARLAARRPRARRRSKPAPGAVSPPNVIPFPRRVATVPPPLPIPSTPLVGREREVAALVEALGRPEVRVLTLSGPGGVGKTRLALAVARDLAAAFPDGVWFVDLSPVRDPALVAPAIAQALGVREAGVESLAARIALFLGERRVLLVLDNFEQVVAAAPLVAELLAACPRLTVLATSRVPLRLSGERERSVEPLALPERRIGDRGQGIGGALSLSPDAVVEAAAVQLFVGRAQVVRPDFAVTTENAAAMTAICRHLDGLPLAIELAAARIKVLTPPELLARLDRRLPLLTGGPRDKPQRLQTLRDAIAWSYDLLSPVEQTIFRRLSVFVGGFTLDAAEWVLAVGCWVLGEVGAGDEGRRGEGERTPPVPNTQHPTPNTLDLVAALVDQSLLQVEPAGDGGETRYGMLETIREYGLERLAASGEEVDARSAHAEWSLAFAQRVGPLTKGADAPVWLRNLEREHPNLRTALAWLAERHDGHRLTRLAGALWQFWCDHAHFGDGQRWLELAIGMGEDAPAADRLRVLTGAGAMAWHQSDVARAMHWDEQALALARAVGDRTYEAAALIDLALAASETGDVDRAVATTEAALAIARETGNHQGAVVALANLGGMARERGDLTEALRRYEEALALARALGVSWILPTIVGGLGFTSIDLGEYARAAAYFHEGLDLAHARGNLSDVIAAMEGQSRVVAADGQQWQAARLFGAAAALREEIGSPMMAVDLAYVTPFLDMLRDALGHEHFTAAWAAGRALPRRDAIAEALALSAAANQTPAAGNGVAAERPPLTGRELEILRLLANGASDHEIGDRLFISPTTVARHVANIRGKLGVNSRAKVAAFAHRHGLG